MATKLKPPLITFERAKITVILLLIAISAEVADPRDFGHTGLARLLYFAIVVEIIRQVLVWRREVNLGAVIAWESRKARWAGWKERFEPNSLYRMRRAMYLVGGYWIFGALVNSMTDRCGTAFQCAVLLPRLALENLPEALRIAVYISFGFAQLGLMMWALTKVGFVKFVYPGTILETFDDVFGQDHARDALIEQVDLLEDDAEVSEAGGYLPKGVIVWGPPGTGKTLMAKAAANRSTKPLILIPPGAFASTFMGINYLKVWSLFRYIRKFALRYGGVIVFFDEIDSLGNRGGGIDQATPADEWPACTAPSLPSGHTALGEGIAPPTQAPSAVVRVANQITQIIMTGGSQNMGTLEAFLAAMEGMDEPRGIMNRLLVLLGLSPMPAPKYRYLMIGATNRLSVLDAALTRAGRFGRKIHVDYPKYDGRLATYDGYLGKIKHSLTPEQISWAARNHHNGTGAEIKDIVNEALLITFRHHEKDQGVVGFKDLMDAMLWVRYGESTGQFERDRNQWGVAIHEASHAAAFHYLKRDELSIWLATVEQHGRTGGFVAPSPHWDDWKKLRSDMVDEIAVFLASRVGEELFLGEPSNGHGGDGPAATDLARKMVQLGHGKSIGFYGPDERPKDDWQSEVEDMLAEGYQRARDVLEPRMYQLAALASLLRGEGTVDGQRIHELFDTMEAATA